MDVRHWTEDDFLNRAYGLGSADEAHLRACPECSSRAAEFDARRGMVTAEPEVSPEFLAAQRRAIYRRLGERRRISTLVWAPAALATASLAIGLMLSRPDTKMQGPAPQGDDAVFAEIYALEQSGEPMAVKPMHALFEEN